MLLGTLQNHVRTLATLNETQDPVITCYLNLENGLKEAQHTYMKARSRMRRGIDSEVRLAFESAADRIMDTLTTGDLRGVRGVAIFSREGGSPFFLVLPFGVPVPNWVTVDTLPNIYHLVELKDTFHRYVILLCSNNSARVMEVHLGTITANLWKDMPELRKRVGREWTKHHFQDHRQARTDQFFKGIVRMLEQSMASGGYKHIILAGSMDVTERVRRLLPKHLEEKVLDSIVANRNDNADDVVEATLATFIEEEQRESMTRVEEVQRELRSRGLATIGHRHTKRALEYGQVDVLVLARELDPDIKEPLVRLAERTSCEIETVDGSHWLLENEGVGALLRYWTPEAGSTQASDLLSREEEALAGRRHS
jgi:hypothetical protein